MPLTSAPYVPVVGVSGWAPCLPRSELLPFFAPGARGPAICPGAKGKEVGMDVSSELVVISLLPLLSVKSLLRLQGSLSAY